jgi:thiosulfate dehydrogenase [quinone] large subunit
MQSKGLKITLAIMRFVLAIEFLWAFFDKLIGLGFSTQAGSGWISGGSPTFGFLAKGSTGPFAPMYQKIGGSGIIDWLFMLALLFIGLVLLFGIGMRIGTITGCVLMILMWSATLPKPNNFFQIDDHIIILVALLILLFAKAGQVAGLGRWWSNTRLVRKYPGLE